MTEAEANELLAHRGERLCGRIYRRADGTILTRDCPIGLRALRRRMWMLVGRTAAVIAFLVTGLAFARARSPERTFNPWSNAWSRGDAPVLRTIKQWLDPSPAPMPGLLGAICLPAKNAQGPLHNAPSLSIDATATQMSESDRH
jgi:hypothetical protein